MKRLFIMLAVTALMAGNVFAGNVDTFGIGAKATSLGGAYSANASDPFAAYYNPAGLVGQERKASVGLTYLDPSLKVSGYTVDSSNNALDIAPKDFEDESDPLLIPSLGFVQPINDKIAVGLAVYVPYGLDISWDEDPSSNPGAYNATHSWYIREVITPSIAYQVDEKLALGFGISIGKTESGVERRAYAPGQPYDGENIKTDLTDDMNYSINLGALYSVTPTIDVGFTYRGRTKTEMEGTTEIETSLPLSNKSVDASTDVDAPEQIQVGINYHPHDRFNLEFDLVWTNWSIIDGYTVDLDPALLGAVNEEEFDRNWKDTKQIRIGAEWVVTDTLTLRGGYFYDPSPIPDSTFDLVWPDADKKVYSFGAGYDFGNGITVDGFVQYIIAEYKREIGGESDNLNHTYEPAGSGLDAEVSMEADGNLIGYGVTVNYAF